MRDADRADTAVTSMGRRELVTALGALAAASALPAGARASSPTEPVVETSTGRVRGERAAGGGYRFMCVPYGASTAGLRRFLPPAPVTPWAGVREPPRQRLIAPQINPAAQAAPPGSARAAISGIGSEAGSLETEDCLNVTIYTPGLDSGRRPVMFWCHGGGYFAGSGSAPMYDGTPLAVHGDVVVVNVTHRLGVLGFLQLEGAGEDFAASGNVGMMDIALALKWVRENIERFGGDPRRVTIFGQSGGGGKVAVLMSMPSAKGLFHRAVMQSGALRRMRTREDAAEVAAALTLQLGIKTHQARELQQVPLRELMDAYFGLAKMTATPGKPLNLEPVLDGRIVPHNPFDPVADPLSASVPLIVGNVGTENTAFMLGDEAAFKLDEAALKRRLHALLGERAGEEAVALYSYLQPKASPSDLYFKMLSDRTRRQSVLVAELKAAQGAGRAYLYEMLWRTPVFDGMLRSPHSLDLPLIFDLAADPRWAPYTGAGPGAAAVSRALRDAWLAFAHGGAPGTAQLPWPAYSLDRRDMMLFDEASKAGEDPIHDTRVFWDNVANGVI
jgi:para-nitrobenzyl esterase